MSNLNIPDSAVSDYNAMQANLAQEASIPTDSDVFDWVHKNKSVADRETCLAEDTFFMVSLLGCTRGTLEALKTCSKEVSLQSLGKLTLRETAAAFRRSWEDEIIACMDNGEEA